MDIFQHDKLGLWKNNLFSFIVGTDYSYNTHNTVQHMCDERHISVMYAGEKMVWIQKYEAELIAQIAAGYITYVAISMRHFR